MALLNAVWLVITLPFRAFFWFCWQAARVGSHVAIGLQRRFGQRNTALILAAGFAAFGLAHLSGMWRCGVTGPFCRAGDEPFFGLLYVALAGTIALHAFRRLTHDTSPGVSMEKHPLRYDRSELALSWRSVVSLFVFVLLLTGGVAIVMWLRGL